MFNLNPRDNRFFDVFIEQSEIIEKAGILLKKGFEDLEEKNNIAIEIGKLEHSGDEIERGSVVKLNEAFITPIDREDIHALVKMLDDVLDYIDSTANLLIMYDIKETREEALEMCNKIIVATKETHLLMEELKKIGQKNNKLIEKIKIINDLEHEGDKIYRKTITNLFKNEKDTLNIIKWKDIYSSLENTLDMCERIAVVVEGVVMKNV